MERESVSRKAEAREVEPAAVERDSHGGGAIANWFGFENVNVKRVRCLNSDVGERNWNSVRVKL